MKTMQQLSKKKGDSGCIYVQVITAEIQTELVEVWKKTIALF